MGPARLLLLAALLLVAPAAAGTGRDDGRTRLPATPAAGRPSLAVSFEANRGQAEPGVAFLARGAGFRLLLAADRAALVLPRGTGAAGPAGDPPAAPPAEVLLDVVRMRFEGARPGATLEGTGPLGARSHYLLGRDPSKWVREVPHFAGAVARDLWPGVDLRWRGLPGGRVEYDLLVAPGADPGAAAISFEGAEARLDPSGDLVLRFPGGEVRHGRPSAWQDGPGGRTPVAVRFEARGPGRFGFAPGPFDRARALVVDPVIHGRTFAGGSSTEYCHAMAADGSGRPVLAGATYSTAATFPLLNAVQTTLKGSSDAFVTRLSADLGSLLSSTYLGGTGYEVAYAVAVDGTGAIYAGGTTSSYDYPVASAFQAELDYYDSQGNGQNSDAFVTKLSPSGSSLAWSTYLGGGGAGDTVLGLAVDGDGQAVAVGNTGSKEFPVKNPIQGSVSDWGNGFLTKFAASGSSLLWSTYVGGGSQDYVNAVAIDSSGVVHFVGLTDSGYGIGANNAWQTTPKGIRDAIVGRIAADGASLLSLGFLGGGATENARALALDPDGGVWVAGWTDSTDFPVKGAWQEDLQGNADAFLAKIGADPRTLERATYFGGEKAEDAFAVTLDARGGVLVAGMTNSAGFPLQDPLQGSFGGGSQDAYVAAFGRADGALRFSTYLGGVGYETGTGLRVPEDGAILVSGMTSSGDFPTGEGWDSALGADDAYLVRLVEVPAAPGDPSAVLAGLTKVEFAWTDGTDLETGYAVERKAGLPGTGTWEPLADLPAGSTSLLDPGLDPDTTYTYRVKARGTFRDSAWATSEPVATPPPPTYPPAAPSGLTAVVVSSRRVDLAWQDNSLDEDFFTVARALGPGLYETLATPRLGSTSWSDGSVLPDRAYAWKVRAQNPLGPSLFTNVAAAVVPASLEPALVKGRVKDLAATGKDSVLLKGVLALGAEALAPSVDPSGQAFLLRLGDWSGPALVSIPAGDPGWRLRKGKWTWKQPKGSITKATVVLVPETGEFSVKLKKLSLAAAPANPIRFSFGVGTDGGHLEADWTPGRKAGDFRFP